MKIIQKHLNYTELAQGYKRLSYFIAREYRVLM